MIAAIIFIMMGPILLILGIAEDATLYIIGGAIVTIIDIALFIYALIPEKKEDTAQYNPYSRMSVEQLISAPIPGMEKTKKPASVVKRGVVGTMIGGVPGAIIGAASAIDANNKMNKK